MMSAMSTSSDGGVEFPPPDRVSGAVEGGRDGVSNGAGGSDSAGRVEFNAAGEEAATASLAGDDGSSGARVYDDSEDSRVLKLESEASAFVDVENQVSASVSGMPESMGSMDLGNGKREGKTVVVDHRSMITDYNSFLSAFDDFASKAKAEAVGHGYYIGDMVWGKVKSHPWWPGQIYNEALASPSVWRTKHEGQVLVAFFGDNSYGWFDPAELIPFEENFVEKWRQTTSKAFLNAVEEAVDEVSRRRSLGVACRCRNEFNFQPSSVDGYFVVDVGDNEPGVYGWNQINKAQDSFQPREMFLFVEQLALQPMNHEFWEIEFIKNKATVLACRKVRFEEFDETYAQAFGTASVRPPHASAPVVVGPAKAPLSGRLVIAEALGQGKISVKPAKTQNQIEKDKYLFKRRDDVQMKSKKAIYGSAGPSPHLLSFDGLGFSDKVMHTSTREQMHQASAFTITYNQHQPKTHEVSVTSGIKHSEGLSRHIEGGKKKVTIQKRVAVELNAENAALTERRKKKKKKEMKTETIGNFRQLPPAFSYGGPKVENATAMPLHFLLMDAKPDNQKGDPVVGSFCSQSQQETDFGKFELQMMVQDLRALALNPFHGMDRSCPAVIQQVFLKYRSLVYQKSLALLPSAEHEASERNSNKSLAATVLVGPTDKTIEKKIVKPVVRLDEPPNGGKNRGPFDRPEDVKKRKHDVLEENKKKKKLDDFGDMKKKQTDESRLLAAERKILQRPIASQRIDAKENAAKNASAAPSKPVKLETGSRIENTYTAPPKAVKLDLGNRVESAAKNAPAAQPKAVKLQSSSKMEHTVRLRIPTMLVMKFPAGAALPSGAELRAKFARFGQLDHSATRVFWKTYTCRLVFMYKVDAQAALKFALGSSNLFGNTNVRCYIRERESEAAEPEPSKIQKEDVPPVNTTLPRDTATEQRAAAKSSAQAAQLKSCLKKPSGDEAGNANGRATRVKFILGRDEATKGAEPSVNENKNRIASLPQGTSSTQLPETSSKILLNIIPPSTQSLPANTPHPEPRPRPTNIPLAQPMLGVPPVIDTSGQMLSLLLKCNDVVNNLMSKLGYMPYHPL